ncbi:PPE domain-containing protein [Saccharopolyspora sp. NPDC002376]
MSSPEQPDIVLTETQNWASRSHEELYAAVHTDNDPGRVGQLSDEWNGLSRDIGEAAQRMSERVRGTETGWQGQAADAARAAIQELADWNVQAGDTAGSLAARISTQGRVMEVAKAEMPEPVKGGEVLTAAVIGAYATNDLESFTRATNDLQAHQAQATSAHERAVQVMTNMEAQSRTIDSETPRFTPPPNPVTEERMHARMAPMAAGGADQQLEPQKQGRPMDPQQQGQPLEPQQQGQPMDPASTTPEGMSPAAANGPGGIDGPTKAMPMPKLGDGPAGPGALGGGPGGIGGGPGGGFDGPTKAMPMPKLGDGPAGPGALGGGPGGIGGGPGGGFDSPTKSMPMPNIPPLDPSGTTPQGTSPQGTSPQSFKPPTLPTGPGGNGDHTYQPRPYMGPGPQLPSGPNRNRPGSNQPGNQNGPGWRGQVPPIPGGPGGLTGPGGGGPGGTGGGPGGFRGGPGAIPSLGGGGGVGGGAGGAGVGAGGGASGSSNLAPGGSSGTGGGRPGDPGLGARGMGGGAGQAGAAGAPGMGGGAMGNRGRGGEEDKERSAKYVQGGQIVEVPGADLPPPVIGEGKKKKRDQG